MVFYAYLAIYHPFPGPVPRHRVDWQVWGGGVFLKKGGRDERLRYYRDIQQDNCQRRLQTSSHLQAILCMEADCIPLIRQDASLRISITQHHTSAALPWNLLPRSSPQKVPHCFSTKLSAIPAALGIRSRHNVVVVVASILCSAHSRLREPFYGHICNSTHADGLGVQCYPNRTHPSPPNRAFGTYSQGGATWPEPLASCIK